MKENMHLNADTYEDLRSKISLRQQEAHLAGRPAWNITKVYLNLLWGAVLPRYALDITSKMASKTGEYVAVLERERPGIGDDPIALDTLEDRYMIKPRDGGCRSKEPEEPLPVVYQYYMRRDDCPSIDCSINKCICWHDQGTGPMPGIVPNNKPGIYWREKI